MKKLIVLALVVGLVTGFGVTAEAGKRKKKPRTVTLEYAHPTPGVAAAGASLAFCAGWPEGDCDVPVKPTEKYFKVTVNDASGNKVAGFVSQGDLNGNGVSDDGYATFCGAHPSAQAIAAPGTAITVYLSSGACADGTTSTMTTGTIKVQLSAKPF
jgi:hypothetical protein